MEGGAIVKKIVISAIVGISLLSSVLVASARQLLKEYPRFILYSGQGHGVTLQSVSSNFITEFSPTSIYNTNLQQSVRYEVYREIGNDLVIQQNRTYNIVSNASGYFDMGYVGTGTIDVYALAYNNGHTINFTGWSGVQRYYSA